eukprot:TCALIF_12943-PA protein Name:"Protein of unknown function" AED:0.40 eAED:0.40 QI:0/-1/0/1/-1/1/1/0/191
MTLLSQSEQLAQLRAFQTPEFLAHTIHMTEIPHNTTLGVEAVLDKIQFYLKSQRNLGHDSYDLIRRRQGITKAYTDFYTGLREAAEATDLCNINHESWLGTLILVGIRSEETRQKILERTPPPTLVEIHNLCQAQENAERHGKALLNLPSQDHQYSFKESEINKLKSTYQRNKMSRTASQHQNQQKNNNIL